MSLRFISAHFGPFQVSPVLVWPLSGLFLLGLPLSGSLQPFLASLSSLGRNGLVRGPHESLNSPNWCRKDISTIRAPSCAGPKILHGRPQMRSAMPTSFVCAPFIIASVLKLGSAGQRQVWHFIQ